MFGNVVLAKLRLDHALAGHTHEYWTLFNAFIGDKIAKSEWDSRAAVFLGAEHGLRVSVSYGKPISIPDLVHLHNDFVNALVLCSSSPSHGPVAQATSHQEQEQEQGKTGEHPPMTLDPTIQSDVGLVAEDAVTLEPTRDAACRILRHSKPPAMTSQILPGLPLMKAQLYIAQHEIGLSGTHEMVPHVMLLALEAYLKSLIEAMIKEKLARERLQEVAHSEAVSVADARAVLRRHPHLFGPLQAIARERFMNVE